MLSKELEKSLNGVAQEASLKRHEFVTVEHLLLALLNNDQAINVLVNVGADVEKLRAELETIRRQPCKWTTLNAVRKPP